MADSLKPRQSYAIGPSWKSYNTVYSLANLSGDLNHEITSTRVSRDTIKFDIQYRSNSVKDATILQRYTLFKQNVSITSRIDNPNTTIDSLYFTVPLLVSTGLSKTDIVEGPGKVTVNYLGHQYSIEFDKNNKVVIGQELFANRNGIYRNLIIRTPGNLMQVNLKLE
jgi:hypothetical protein